MVTLTPRLRAVANCVHPGSVVADIGTDHAYIPAYLVQQGVISKAFACDINEGPLENAKKTVERENLSGVRFLLSDGLKGLEKEQFDTVIIAGMGGEMIASILEESPWCRQKGLHFVLQPMTRESHLRRYLAANGFHITGETLAAEKEKLYTVIEASFTGVPSAITDAQALLGNAFENELFERKRALEIKRLQKIQSSLKNKENASGQEKELEALIKEVEVYSC